VDPLHHAVRANRADNFQPLIVNKVNKDAANDQGNTALHLAAENGKNLARKKLLENGARKDLLNKDDFIEEELLKRVQEWERFFSSLKLLE
jgi:ankyrin repeat protein